MSEDLEPEREPQPAEEARQEANPEAEQTEETGTGRRTTILIVAAAVVVLVAIGVGIYLVASSGDEDTAKDPDQPTITGSAAPEEPANPPQEEEPPASPPNKPKPPADPAVAAARTAAEQAATAINERDVNAMKELSCDPGTVGSADSFPPEATARLVENPKITGDKATAQLELSIQGSEPSVVPLPMEKRGGKWCVP